MGERLADTVWVAWAAMRAQNRGLRGSPFTMLLGVIQPVAFLIVSAAAYRAPSAADATHLVVGVGLTALWGSTIWAAGGILRRDQYEGTLAATVTGVRSPYVVLLGKSLGATLRSSLFITVSTVTAATILRLPLHAAAPGWMLLGLGLAVLSGTALGMLLSCLFLVTRHGLAWSSALIYPVFILGGMMIPTHMLPSGLQVLSTLVSLRWAAQFVTGAAGGAPQPVALLALTALTVAYLWLAFIAFRAVVNRAREQGTLDFA